MMVTRLEPSVVTPLRCRYPREPVRHLSWHIQEVARLEMEAITPSIIRKALSRLHRVQVERAARLVSA